MGDADNGYNSGSAYIFECIGGSWIEVAKLTASDGAANDGFSWSASIYGTYAIIGAVWDDDKGSSSGSAYIFERIGGSWIEVAKLTASDGTSNDYFSSSVSISGDNVIIGASGDDDKGSLSGSAYIFEHVGSSWTQVAKLTASDGEAGDEFGYTMAAAIYENYAIVGAPFDDDNGYDSGSAYVFEHVGSTWTEITKLTASDTVDSDEFGESVSIYEDEVIVGAPWHIISGSYTGSAYIYNISNYLP